MLLALNGIVSGASFQPIESMTILTSALIFGAGHFEGALLTGLFGQLIPNFLSDVGLPRDIAPVLFAVGGVFALSRGEGGLSAAVRAAVRKPSAGRGASQAEVGSSPVRPPAAARRRAGGAGTVLDIRQVSVSYGAVKALHDVSLTIPEGGIYGLIGPNGAGKSTLVDALSGFVTGHDGRFFLDGEDITALPPRKRAVRGLRRTFQQGHTPRDLTVGGYLTLCATQQSTSVAEALDWFSLPSAQTPISALDVGTRRILEVCGALMPCPRIALLDEPTAGLAGPDREAFVASLTAVTARSETAVLLIEHDIDVVLGLCDSVAVLDFGELIAAGSPRDVLRDPKVVAAYLGAEK